MKPVPVASVDVSGREEEYLLDALRSSWISSSGPYVQRFEREFASLTGARAAVGTCNGTAALHLALLTLGVGRGDEVVIPSLTYVAVANACRYVGAQPVFVDVEPGTWCMDPERVEAAITSRTRALIPVHLYGHPADMDPLMALAQRNGLGVVEDAAEAHGAKYKGRPVGSLGDVGTFSFFANKILTCGEGGALTVQSTVHEACARQLRDHGMDPLRRYHFPVTGYNYRITNLACALLCAQLERLEGIVRRRRAIFAAYRAELQDTPGVSFQPVAPWAEPAPWMFNIVIDEQRYGRSRDELARLLAAEGIETRPLFPLVHLQPPFVQEGMGEEAFPVSRGLAECAMSLPTFNSLEQVAVEAVSGFIRSSGR